MQFTQIRLTDVVPLFCLLNFGHYTKQQTSILFMLLKPKTFKDILRLTVHCLNHRISWVRRDLISSDLISSKIWQVIVQTVNTLVYCIRWYFKLKGKMTKHSCQNKSPEGQAMLFIQISFNNDEIFHLKGSGEITLCSLSSFYIWNLLSSFTLFKKSHVRWSSPLL